MTTNNTQTLLQTVGCNISQLVAKSARKFGEKPAIVSSHWDAEMRKNVYNETSYQVLDQLISDYAFKFQSQGICNNERVLLMIPPGIEMIASVFAILRLGAVVVLVDGGIELEKLLGCVETSQPSAMIGVAGIIGLSRQQPNTFASIRTVIGVGDQLPNEVTNVSDIVIIPEQTFIPSPKHEDELSIILFTSGSTGLPKGVEYTPRMLISQLDTMNKTWGLSSDDVNMPIFPAFTIGSIGLGMTVVIPDMDTANPAHADPERIHQAMKDYKVTYSFAAPAFWLTLLEFCRSKNVELPHMSLLLVGGAPVPDDLLIGFQKYLPNGKVQVTLGATEASAVTTIADQELIDDTLAKTHLGHGVCVGGAVKGCEIGIIPLEAVADNNGSNEKSSSEFQALGAFEMGELVVTGGGVSQRYFENLSATASSKFTMSNGKQYHRMGDSGYIDDKGRFWFCGRVAQICEAHGSHWFPSKIEAALDYLPCVRRTALVSIIVDKAPSLVLCVELYAARVNEVFDPQRFQAILDSLNYPLKYTLECKDGFPVDIRHNSKIDRKKLKQWVQLLADEKIIGSTKLNVLADAELA